ncbi:hypothetical protein P9112_005916 [Eukaryota sp. TZLM1-RC]
MGGLVALVNASNIPEDVLKHIHSNILVNLLSSPNSFSLSVDSDCALVIQAMDFLHSNSVSCFVLVSSSTDLSPLVIRLKQSEKRVIGVGSTDCVDSYSNSCDRFIYFSNTASILPSSPTIITDLIKKDNIYSKLCQNIVLLSPVSFKNELIKLNLGELFVFCADRISELNQLSIEEFSEYLIRYKFTVNQSRSNQNDWTVTVNHGVLFLQFLLIKNKFPLIEPKLFCKLVKILNQLCEGNSEFNTFDELIELLTETSQSALIDLIDCGTVKKFVNILFLADLFGFTNNGKIIIKSFKSQNSEDLLIFIGTFILTFIVENSSLSFDSLDKSINQPILSSFLFGREGEKYLKRTTACLNLLEQQLPSDLVMERFLNNIVD